jgi:hypothetical protein
MRESTVNLRRLKTAWNCTFGIATTATTAAHQSGTPRIPVGQGMLETIDWARRSIKS